MNTLKDYVDWKLTHPSGYKSRNLFDKDNFAVQSSYYANTAASTDTGISFYTASNSTVTTYGHLRLVIGYASEFKGKTITFSSPSFNGTSGTKLAVFNSAGTSVKNGTNFTKFGDVYYSAITVDDKEYTSETLCIVLYYYGKEPDTLIVYDEIMVNEGSEILPYEPYGKYIKR